MAETVKRWTMDGLGRDRLKLESAPIPAPGPGEILAKVSAVSLNYRDKLAIETGMGLTLNFPFTPASDMAGTVVAAGQGAARFEPGSRVITTFIPDWIDGPRPGGARVPPYRSLGGSEPGVLADYVAFPEDWFSLAPESLDDAECSTLPCAGLTAWFALAETGRVRAGETVVVQGTGGVALFGLQIAKAHGATVIVTSGSDDKLARAKALGADHGVNRLSENWVEAVHRLTGDRGADHVLDTVGGGNFGRSIEAAAVDGRVSVIGVLDGFTLSGPTGPLILKSVTAQGVSVGHRRALEDFVRAVDRLRLKPVIDRRYRFDELPAALDHLDRGPFGKIVLEL